MKGLKTGGRKAGTPNKQTQELMELADSKGVSPFEFLLMVMHNDLIGLGLKKENPESEDDYFAKDIPLPLRIRAAEELSNYLYAKRKAIEIKNEDPPEPPKFIINLSPTQKDGGD